MDDRETMRSLTANDGNLQRELIVQGGTLLAEFASVGDIAGVRSLLDCGVSPTSLYREGDAYFDVAKDSTGCTSRPGEDSRRS